MPSFNGCTKQEVQDYQLEHRWDTNRAESCQECGGKEVYFFYEELDNGSVEYHLKCKECEEVKQIL